MNHLVFVMKRQQIIYLIKNALIVCNITLSIYLLYYGGLPIDLSDFDIKYYC